MTAPWAFWSADTISRITQCPAEAVSKHWPLIEDALARRGIADRPTQLAAIGTVAIETASTFEPVREAFWLDEAWRREYLRYYPYYGRGYVQLTWEANYTSYGADVGVDLHADPDRALEPVVAADILAAYFAGHGGGPLIPAAARRGDWREVRRLVQGGAAGLERLVTIATALDANKEPDPMPRVTYNKSTPAIAQNDPWSCSTTSTRWALESVGRDPSESWIESQMLADGVVSKELGLLDASGAGLAAWLEAQYGEFGYLSNNEPLISFAWAAAEGGHAYPFLIGGRNWGHWAAVRDYDPVRDLLLLMNPAPGWMGVGDTMDRGQLATLGPFSAVRLWHPDLVEPPPLPPPPPTISLAEIRAELVDILSASDDALVGAYFRRRASALADRIPSP